MPEFPAFTIVVNSEKEDKTVIPKAAITSNSLMDNAIMSVVVSELNNLI